ncbi:MAG: GNAT family N-acetyltransferase, partial [Pseudomonadota bacterium]
MARLGLVRGRYEARLAEGPEDVAAAQRLRHQVFRADRNAPDSAADGLDRDAFDARCDHMLLFERKTGDLVCCFRLMPLSSGAEIAESYSAQYYELSKLREFPGPMVEMGRFCIHSDHRNADALRVAWAAMTQYVDERGFELMFGCSSFEGNDAEVYLDAFAFLQERHIAPKRWLPRVKAPKVFKFAKKLAARRA